VFGTRFALSGTESMQKLSYYVMTAEAGTDLRMGASFDRLHGASQGPIEGAARMRAHPTRSRHGWLFRGATGSVEMWRSVASSGRLRVGERVP